MSNEQRATSNEGMSGLLPSEPLPGGGVGGVRHGLADVADGRVRPRLQNWRVTRSDNDLASAILSPHAVVRMAKRGIPETDVRAVLEDPGEQEAVRPGRVIVTSLKQSDQGKRAFVVRVVVDIDRSPPVVVTVYRPSKIGKYWSQT